MALTKQQKRLLAQRTTASSKRRLRQSPAFKRRGGGGSKGKKPAKAPAKKRPNLGPLYDPSKPLSGRVLQRAAQQITQTEFASERAELDRTTQQTNRQGQELVGRASDYYTQLAKQEAGAVARAQAVGGQLQGQLSQNAQQSQAALSGIDQEAQQRAAQDASLRGGHLSGGGADAVAQEVAAQRALAQTQAAGAQNQAALSTSNWANLANVANTARGVAGGEAVQRFGNQLLAQTGELRGRRADLAKQVAARRAQNVLTLRQQGFENAVTARGLDIDMAELRADMQEKKADNRLARQRIKSAERQNRQRVKAQIRGQNVTKRGQDITARNNLVTSADRRRGQDITANQRAADRRVRQQMSQAKAKQAPNESTESKKMRNGVANAIADIRAGKEGRVKRDAPPLVYQAAREIREIGFVRPGTVNELRSAGMRIPQSWLPPSKRRGYKPPYKSSNIPHNKI
jgi:hypothetical protein